MTMPDPRAERMQRIKRLERMQRIKKLEAVKSGQGDIAADVGSVAKNATSILRGPGLAENIPVLGPLARRAGEGFRAVIEGGFGDETIPDAYTRIRSENDRERQQYAEEHPIADVSKKLLGGVGGAGALPVLGAGVSGALGVGGRIAGAVGTEAADATLRGLTEEEIKRAGSLSGGIQAGLEAVPLVGKFAGPLGRTLSKSAEKTAGVLDDAAGMRATKHALGNNARAWKNLGGEREAIAAGKQAIKDKTVKFARSPRFTEKAARKKTKESWGDVEKVFEKMGQAAEETAGGSLVKGADVADNIEATIRKLPATPEGKREATKLQNYADFFRDRAMILPEEAQKIKKSYKWSMKDPAMVELGFEGTNTLNRAFGDAIKKGARQSGVKGAEDFAENYSKYGQRAAIRDGAKEHALRLRKNRTFSLTDHLVGGSAAGVGAGAGLALGGGYDDAALGGTLGAIANRMMRTRGNASIAVGLSQAAKALRSGTASSAQILKALESGALGGKVGIGIAHQIMLQSQPKQAEDQRTSQVPQTKSYMTEEQAALDRNLVNKYRPNAKDPMAQPFEPGQAAMRKVDQFLGDKVVDPLARRGYPGLGAGIATGLGTLADFAIPQTSGDLAGVVVPFGKAGKALGKVEARSASAEAKLAREAHNKKVMKEADDAALDAALAKSREGAPRYVPTPAEKLAFRAEEKAKLDRLPKGARKYRDAQQAARVELTREVIPADRFKKLSDADLHIYGKGASMTPRIDVLGKYSNKEMAAANANREAVKAEIKRRGFDYVDFVYGSGTKRAK